MNNMFIEIFIHKLLPYIIVFGILFYIVQTIIVPFLRKRLPQSCTSRATAYSLRYPEWLYVRSAVMPLTSSSNDQRQRNNDEQRGTRSKRENDKSTIITNNNSEDSNSDTSVVSATEQLFVKKDLLEYVISRYPENCHNNDDSSSPQYLWHVFLHTVKGRPVAVQFDRQNGRVIQLRALHPRDIQAKLLRQTAQCIDSPILANFRDSDDSLLLSLSSHSTTPDHNNPRYDDPLYDDTHYTNRHHQRSATNSNNHVRIKRSHFESSTVSPNITASTTITATNTNIKRNLIEKLLYTKLMLKNLAKRYSYVIFWKLLEHNSSSSNNSDTQVVNSNDNTVDQRSSLLKSNNNNNNAEIDTTIISSSPLHRELLLIVEFRDRLKPNNVYQFAVRGFRPTVLPSVLFSDNNDNNIAAATTFVNTAKTEKNELLERQWTNVLPGEWTLTRDITVSSQTPRILTTASKLRAGGDDLGHFDTLSGVQPYESSPCYEPRLGIQIVGKRPVKSLREFEHIYLRGVSGERAHNENLVNRLSRFYYECRSIDPSSILTPTDPEIGNHNSYGDHQQMRKRQHRHRRQADHDIGHDDNTDHDDDDNSDTTNGGGELVDVTSTIVSAGVTTPSTHTAVTSTPLSAKSRRYKRETLDHQYSRSNVAVNLYSSIFPIKAYLRVCPSITPYFDATRQQCVVTAAAIRQRDQQ